MTIDRSEQQRERHQRAMTQKFMRSMQDRAKLGIINYLQTNPHWTPEELKMVINVYIRKYALNNRYVPPVSQASVDAAELYGEESKVETNVPDAGGTETTPVS